MNISSLAPELFFHLFPYTARQGAVGNANPPESKHKEIKRTAANACKRKGDNAKHILRVWNDGQALKALCDGVQWTGFGIVDGKEVEMELVPGAGCQEVLQEVFNILPLDMSPAHPEDGTATSGSGHRPHGFQLWEAVLGADGPSLPPTAPLWQQEVSKTLPSPEQLEGAYDELLGCGRTDSGETCARRNCSFCWRNRGRGLTNHAVVVFNHWGGAPGTVSAGTGTIRGGPVKDASSDPHWASSFVARGSDVEIFLTAEDCLQDSRGLGHTTLGRVAYFFEHQGNDWRRGEGSVIPPGIYTTWAAVSEYVTSGVGNARKVDAATGLDQFRMRQTLSFYPASNILRVVHMMHACPTRGQSACGLIKSGGDRATWRCKTHPTSAYVLNKYFHSVGRDSIA